MIRVVWGTGEGPTALASYDAALAAAGVHNYNLVRVSSVLPANATVETPGTAPDLGPVGGRLTVVEARATGHASAAACLGWAVADAGGIFYEAGAGDDEVSGERVRPDDEPGSDVTARVREGLAAGRSLREWSFEDTETRTVTTGAEEYGTAVVLGVYGDADPL